MFSCDLCDCCTESKDELDTHELFEHNNPCPECCNIFRTYEKLKKHICKLEVTNPTFESYYTKSWVDGNGCNAVHCNKLGHEVIIMHVWRCASRDKTC